MFAKESLNNSFSLFKAMSHPLRYKLLKIISNSGLIGADRLAKQAELSPSECSQQLRFLKSAGLLTTHRNHKHLSYSIDAHRIHKINQSIALFFPESHEA